MRAASPQRATFLQVLRGLLSFLIFSELLILIGMNHPFAGAVKVRPEALSAVLEEIQSRPERP
jgi:hypothetical protein